MPDIIIKDPAFIGGVPYLAGATVSVSDSLGNALVGTGGAVWVVPPVPAGAGTVLVTSSRLALATDNGATLELTSGVTLTLTNAVLLPQGVNILGPASGTATIAVADAATINSSTSPVTVAANQAYTALPRSGSSVAFLVKGG